MVLGHPARVIGSCVRRDASLQRDRILTVLNNLEQLLVTGQAVPSEKVELWDGALAPGYGQIGQPALDAMTTMARTEGLTLDPVYTAKVFAAIPALVESGDIPKGSRVLLVHTGGLASLFAYQTDLEQLLGIE